jgi:predicted RNase H-like HicB family nuclease
MNLPVLIEPIQDGGFRARSGEPLALTAEASTREEAIAKLRQQVQSRVASGQELISLPVETSPALPAGAGVFKDDPLFDEWQAAIAEYRRQKDAEEGF